MVRMIGYDLSVIDQPDWWLQGSSPITDRTIPCVLLVLRFARFIFAQFIFPRHADCLAHCMFCSVIVIAPEGALLTYVRPHFFCSESLGRSKTYFAWGCFSIFLEGFHPNGDKRARSVIEKWWDREDSNLQPDGYERPALTIELRTPPWRPPPPRLRRPSCFARWTSANPAKRRARSRMT